VEIRDAKGVSYGRVRIPGEDGGAARKEFAAELSHPFPTGRQAVAMGFLAEDGFLDKPQKDLFELESFSFR
ncbi:MAG: hypothetical protein IKQ17_01140, partial [Kiritimatiellae bacterium]|nr:hypothetical protein [Kiritimatiellia bacterium]